MSIEEMKRRQEFRKMYLKHLETIQMLPADQVNAYLEKRENNAAATIQAFWKGYKLRRKLKEAEYSAKENKAAIIIQRQVRKWLSRINENSTKVCEYSHTLSKKEIDELYLKVEKWKEKALNSKPTKQEEVKEQFHKAREMLELFYLNRPKRMERFLNIDALLTKIDADIVLFKNLPSLDEVTDEDVRMFHVCSPVVTLEAKLAHESEMKRLNCPWRRDITAINRNEWVDLFPELMPSCFS